MVKNLCQENYQAASNAALRFPPFPIPPYPYPVAKKGLILRLCFSIVNKKNDPQKNSVIKLGCPVVECIKNQ